MLQYGHNFMSEDLQINSDYKDIFSGKNFRHLLKEKVVHPNTICLVLFVDGYQHKTCKKLIKCLSTVL